MRHNNQTVSSTRAPSSTSTRPASDEHRKIEHSYVRTTYREQGATRVVELWMLTCLASAASFADGFSRHTDLFEAFYSTEMVKSWERVVKIAQRDIIKLSARDVFASEQRQAQEIARTVEMKTQATQSVNRTPANAIDRYRIPSRRFATSCACWERAIATCQRIRNCARSSVICERPMPTDAMILLRVPSIAGFIIHLANLATSPCT
jgi:hypothetical protein